MKKILLAISTLAIIIGGVIMFNLSSLNVSANPDYICTKSVSGQACEITSCGEWQNNGTRVCNGKRTTEISYYRTRTTCGAGWTTRRGGGYTSGASGRKTANFPSKTESCNITQIDRTAPDGNISDK